MRSRTDRGLPLGGGHRCSRTREPTARHASSIRRPLAHVCRESHRAGERRIDARRRGSCAKLKTESASVDHSYVNNWLRRAVLGSFLGIAVVVFAAGPTWSEASAGTFGPPTTFYVAVNGSDTNPGTVGAPWRTLQRAVIASPSGSRVEVGPGTYAPFVVSRPNITIAAATQGTVTVLGTRAVRDVILIKANTVTLLGLTIAGCVPNSAPIGGFEAGGSSGVRVDDNVRGVLLDSLTIRDSHGTNADGLPFGCYGVMIHNASMVTVVNSNIYHNGYGVFIEGGGGGISIANNVIHDNDVMVRNTSHVANDDFGGVGIGFNDSSGSSATGNSLYNNFATSHDWGTDGGGIEIYGASNTTIAGNSLSNNDDVLETGAGKGARCANNEFIDNSVVGRTAKSPLQNSSGMILRCATSMLISGNSFTDLDWWTFWIYEPSGVANAVSDLSITGNTIRQSYDQIYSLTSPLASTALHIGDNKYTYKGSLGTNWLHQRMTALAWNGIGLGTN